VEFNHVSLLNGRAGYLRHHSVAAVSSTPLLISHPLRRQNPPLQERKLTYYRAGK